MGTIRRPMGIGPWVRLDIYAEYARMVNENLQGGRDYEAMAVAVVCLDVLLNHMIDGLLLNYKEKLDPSQIEALESLEKGRLPAGPIIDRLEEKHILDHRLVRALKKMKCIRNRLVHPFEKGHLKPDAIIPSLRAGSDEARRSYRLLCHIIDLAGGRSPLKERRELDNYLRERREEKGRSQ